MKSKLFKMYLALIVVSIFIIISSCGRFATYEKVVSFEKNTSNDEKIKKAAHVIPTKQQLEWQQLELTAFIHFGINTFTGREWGDGTESPALFNPAELDAMQWVKALKDGGMKMVILTAKHHDGFCLWPTKTTKHSVASSPWKDGKGDVVHLVKNACDSLNMKFGVYLSPWDRNTLSYGDSPKYNELYRQQLTELLSWYGKVDEVWFDGACGEGVNGKKQEYDWQSYYDIVHQLQPEAVIAIKGEDIRWVGTETGYGRSTEWSVTALAPGGKPEMVEINNNLGINETSVDIGSNTVIEKANHLFWYPAEVDVSIRPGWFYHESEDTMVKLLSQLVDIYFNSVGMNAVLLLNVPPDNRGLINEADVNRLKEFKTWIDSTFNNNLLLLAKTNKERVNVVIDQNPETYWTAKKFPAIAEFKLDSNMKFDIIEIQEYIKKGQRIEEFRVEAWINDEWEVIASGTTVGYKRLIRFVPVKTDRIRIILVNARHDAMISNMGVYLSSEILPK